MCVRFLHSFPIEYFIVIFVKNIFYNKEDTSVRLKEVQKEGIEERTKANINMAERNKLKEFKDIEKKP